MSFFQEETDESNLQYDNAAFLYFIASTLIVGAAITFGSLVKDLLGLIIPHKRDMLATGYLQNQVENLSKLKRSKVFTKGFFIKIAVIAIFVLLTINVYQQSQHLENKMKGFDPFQILGLSPGASLRDVKKAYRKLALQYHPDRNQGNPQAQAKFILISKSYECFTDETKTANCFKYGNPDGAGSFRVGIGLPKLFIQAEYKWYVLPLVLSIFLIVVPCFILQWSNRNYSLDPNGISIRGYRTLFECVEQNANKYSGICLMASYVEIFEHPSIRPISAADRELLEAQLNRNPQARRPAMATFNDRRLQAFWEIYKFCAGIGQFSDPSFREVLQRMLNISFVALIPFAVRSNDGIVRMGNPHWTIRFVGICTIEALCRLSRDYHNRSLTLPDSHPLWINHLSLTPEERKIALQLNVNKIFETLKSKAKVDEFIGHFQERRREAIRRELSELPVYDCQLKAMVDGKPMDTFSSHDYIEIKYRLARQPGNGFCVLSNYPYPMEETIYLLVVDQGSLVLLQKIEFKKNKHQYIGKIPFRAGKTGILTLNFYFISPTYYGLDIFSNITLKVLQPTPQQEDKKIEFHPEDINIEKGEKSFFEKMIDLQLDMDENELSDSEGEEQEKK